LPGCVYVKRFLFYYTIYCQYADPAKHIVFFICLFTQLDKTVVVFIGVNFINNFSDTFYFRMLIAEERKATNRVWIIYKAKLLTRRVHYGPRISL